jgi:hypothetical protein
MAASTSHHSRGRPRVPDETRKRNNVTIRMRDELKAKVEQRAAGQQRSISEEIERRLEGSFAEEDRFGGRAVWPTINLMADAFLRGGQLGANALGHPEWTPEQWMNDATCHRAAVYAVGQALGLPLPTSAQMSDPAAVNELLTGMLAAGAPFTIRKEQDK